MNLQIIPYSPDTLTEKHLKLLQELRPSNPRTLEELKMVLDRIVADSSDLHFALVDGEPVGFIAHRVLYNLYLRKHCLIDDIVVLKAWHRKGIGSKLIQFVENLSKKDPDITTIKLDCGVQRSGAQAFYVKQGLQKKCFTYERPIKD